MYLAGAADGASAGYSVGYTAGHVFGAIEGSAITATAFGLILFTMLAVFRSARR